jgi:beta-N-acetylhexosaminidase
MDLAPVLDIDGRPGPNADNPDGLRSFGPSAEVVTAYGAAFAEGLEAAGELATLKHFPGLGGSTGNSDLGPATTLPWAELRPQALDPFVAAIGEGAPAVLVANDVVPGLTTGPASLSAAVIGGVLRTQLGFQGAVLTDSLSAGAIVDAGYDLPSAAVAAVEAGADLILFGSTDTPAQVALLAPAQVASTADAMAQALVNAVADEQLPESRLDAAVIKVLALTHVSLCPGD